MIRNIIGNIKIEGTEHSINMACVSGFNESDPLVARNHHLLGRLDDGSLINLITKAHPMAINDGVRLNTSNSEYVLYQKDHPAYDLVNSTAEGAGI